MDKGSGFAFVPIFIMVFLACTGQAAAPVSPPESRFVWEPGENLSFTWTNENFDGFYYNSTDRISREFITIKLENMNDRYIIPKYGIIHFKTPGQTNTRYKLFGKHAVLEFENEKYIVEYQEDKSKIKGSNIEEIWLYKILIDDNQILKVENGSRVPLSDGYDIEVRAVNLENASVLLFLKMNGIIVDTRELDIGENFIYKGINGQIIALQVDSVMAREGENSVSLSGIFQTSGSFLKNMNGDSFPVMRITDISDKGISLKNTAGIVELKPGQIVDIGEKCLKVYNSNSLRVLLDCYPVMDEKVHRGAVHTDLNNLTAWDGLNYRGFTYDINSGNYSESLEITNITGRRIQKGGLKYTSYMYRLTYSSYIASMPYAITEINDTEPPGTELSYVTFSLDGNMYIIKNEIAGILTARGVTNNNIKTLLVGPYEIDGETWELGEGYTLTVPSVNYSEDPRRARLVLKRNGVELDDVWLKGKDVYRYTSTEDNEMPKIIAYIETCISGDPFDIIQLRNTWFVSENVTQVKEGDRLGVFNVTAIEPDRIVLTNREPIELKAGSSINLFGNLSFYVENSDELRFYPTNMGGRIVIPAMNNVSDIPDSTMPAPPVAGRTEKTSGFEAVLLVTIILVLYIIGRR